MDLRIFTEPQQGATYDTLLTVAKATEDLGFDAFFRSDHYLKMGSGDGLPGPTDAWITLAGLARETKRIRLGTLMTAGTFRLPGVLAIQVAQVDQMSGGRVELGLGAGWFEEEHTAYGIPFPKEKFGPPGGAAGDRHRAVGDGGRRDLRLPRHPLRPHRLARAAQARPGQDPRAHRRPRRHPHPAAGRAVRRRVQHAVRLGRGQRAPVRPGPRRRRGGRAAGRRPHLLQRPRRLRRQGRRRRSPAGPPPSAARSTS